MSQTEGGSGGTTAPGIRTTRLMELALSERWPVPEAIRAPIIDRLRAIVMNPDVSPREASSAAKALMQASRLNLDSIGAAIRAEEHEEIKERLEKLEEQLKLEGRS